MQNHVNKAKPIVVALLLEPSDRTLLSAGRYLARKLHAPLHLVHAVRPLLSYQGSGDIVINPYYGYELNFSEQGEKTARKKLAALAETIDDVDVHTQVLREFPAEAILTLAQEQQAGLILCGVRSQGEDRNRLFSGLSTGFTLASDAEIPVLLLPLDAKVPFDQSLRLLVADNLESEGEQALKTGLILANALHAEELVHIHVQNMSLTDIDNMIESVRESMILGLIPNDPLLNREYYIERVRSKTREELIRRCHVSKEALNSTRYEPRIAFGEPAEKIHQEVIRNGTQLMIFGRHHLLRKKTLSLGQIPYHAMIEEGVATLVVPDRMSKDQGFFVSEGPKFRGREV